jgi:imidazole glycerol-phosphate synthase subunit HisH
VIALIDYGAGNLTSVRKALAAVGAETFTPAQPADLTRARAVIVPGVGHFAATRPLDDRWRASIRERLETGTSLLGICVGLQWFFEGSAEAPDLPGLGLFPGLCARLPDKGGKVPHVGWNSLSFPRGSRLFDGVASGAQVYFTHSYAAPVVSETVAVCDYAVPFTAAVERGLVSAVQFHPEKSGDVGLRILRNWVQR